MPNCQMFAFLGTDRERLSCAMEKLRDNLTITNGVGYGVVHYTDEAPLLNRRPGVNVAGQSFADIVGGLQTRVVIAHSFLGGTQTTTANNMQPFKFQHWALALTGLRIEGKQQASDLRAKLIAGIPDFIRRHIKGQNCAEVWVHRFFWQLHEADQLKRGQEPLLVAKVMRKSIAELLNIVPDAKPNVVVTEGQRIYVLRAGKDVRYQQRDGIVDCQLCYSEPDQKVPFTLRESHQRFRRFVIAVDAEGFAEDWQSMSENELLIFDRNMEVTRSE